MPAKTARMGREDIEHHRAGRRAAARGGHRRARAAAGRHDVPRRRARDLRRRDLHVSRSGADPDQDARLRRARVNVTLGLPFVRTSPDHGTAFDIAGTGAPNPASLIAALRLAARLASADTGARAVSGIDGLPPLRDVMQPPRSRREEIARPELPARPQSHRPHRARRRPLRDVTVIEVGPGPGGLTRALLARRRAQGRRGRTRRALPAALAEIAARYPGRLDVVEGDALEIDFAALARELARRPGAHRRQPALQYRHARCWSAGSRASHGRPAAIDGADVPARGRRAHRRDAATARRLRPPRRALRLAHAGAILFDVPPSAFTPPPKVTSSVVELVPRAKPAPCDPRDAGARHAGRLRPAPQDAAPER